MTSGYMKNIVGTVVTIILTVVIIIWLGHVVRPVDTDSSISAIEVFHDLPKDSVEVIGYGSSHLWRGLYPMEMYEKYGIGAYNYGCNWQHINTTEMFIEDSFRTQSPKVILIETFRVNEVLEDTNMDGEIYYTRAIPAFDGKNSYLRQCFGNDRERFLSYYVPLCAFHDNWVNITTDNFRLSTQDPEYFHYTMGYIFTAGVTPVSIGDPNGFEQEELGDDAVSVLDRIVELCREKNTDIVFYTAPWQGEFPYGEAMKDYSVKNGCAYLNLFEYMDEIGLDCNSDFCDEGHLNHDGACKVSDFLGGYIKEHYDVSDMRSVPDNMWEHYLKDTWIK